MDPNSNLAEMISLAGRIQIAADTDAKISESDAARLAELVLALNAWIHSGGFLPRLWARK